VAYTHTETAYELFVGKLLKFALTLGSMDLVNPAYSDDVHGPAEARGPQSAQSLP